MFKQVNKMYSTTVRKQKRMLKHNMTLFNKYIGMYKHTINGKQLKLVLFLR